MILLYSNITLVYNESPAFVRQEVDDGNFADLFNYDYKMIENEKFENCTIQDRNPIIDIKGISYTSDSKYLNATIWFDDKFESFQDLADHKYHKYHNLFYKLGKLNLNSSSNLSSFIKDFVNELILIESIAVNEVTLKKIRLKITRSNLKILILTYN